MLGSSLFHDALLLNVSPVDEK